MMKVNTVCVVVTTLCFVGLNSGAERKVKEGFTADKEADVEGITESAAIATDYSFNESADDESDYFDVTTDSNDELMANITGMRDRILGASVVTTNGIFPFALYLKSITSSGTRECTGALLTSEYAITAASCVFDATKISVTAGTYDGTGGTTQTGTPIVHDKYYTNPNDFDLALIKLDTAFILNANIGVINIAFRSNTYTSKYLTGKGMRVFGFGDIIPNSPAITLSYDRMIVISREKCITETRAKGIIIGKNQDCLKTNFATQGGCNPADIGGIVTYKFGSDTAFSLAGVLNYFDTCRSSTPNLFTRIGPAISHIRKYIPIFSNIG